MAGQNTHHVVNSDRSTAEQSSVDAHANHFQQHSALDGHHPTATSTAQSITTTPSLSSELPAHPLIDSKYLADHNSPSSQHSPPEKSNGSPASTTEPRPNGAHFLSANGSQDGPQSADESHVGSDTDISRTGSVDNSKEENRHLGSNSVKKPTSFKAVSVTKTFLAKTAGATPPPTKVGEKSPVPTAAQPVAKPRLVAKTGSGLRDIPRIRPGDGVGAPDGRRVWNKNQPVPLPPPKQFTDEELKQQYGIHLASRLQEDEQDGKSKWADEDDDEEDWAPETVEWMDGTKSTVNATDQPGAPGATPAPPPEPPRVVEQKVGKPEYPEKLDTPEKPEEQAPPVKPTLTALKRPEATTSTTKTILRPGAAQLARQNGLGSMGAAEKQTLIAKATPAPVKSPWAALPPVDKAPPIVINPRPAPQQSSRFAQRDPHGFDSFHANNQPEPAREIAADTFDRSTYREGERSNRELFNSQSGRYEPAPDHRRGLRQQEPFRQPAVLQRSSHQAGPSPAEPSAAFQTRSSAQVDGSSYSRRRGSSVSVGNPFQNDRRLSAAKPPDLSPSQGEAHVNLTGGHDLTLPTSVLKTNAQPALQQSVPAQLNEQAPPASTLEDEIARQKKVLQESREAAKRRKQEEWEREEAEKKERIRKRLEALSAASAQAAPQQETITDQTKPTPVEAAAAKSPEVSAAEMPRQEVQSASPEEQEPSLKLSPKKQRLVEPSPRPFNQTQKPFSRPPPKATFEEPQLPGLKQHSPQQPTSVPYQRHPSVPGSSQGVSGSNFSSPGDHKAQPMRLQAMSNLPNTDTFPLWSSGGMTNHAAPSGNVWGPPTNNRHIGNGTFDTGNFRISSGQLQQHQSAPFSSAPPFGRQYGPRISPQGFGDQRMGPAASLEMRGVEANESTQINGTSPLPETANLAYQPAPIGPPQKVGARLQQQGPRDTSAWTNFAMQAHQRDQDEVARLASERRAQPVPHQRWTETYKQTSMEDGWLGGPRKIVSTEQTVHETPIGSAAFASPAPPISQTSIAHQIASPSEKRSSPGQSTVRLPTGPSSLNKGFSSPADGARPSGRVTPVSMQSLIPAPMTPTSIPQQSRFFPSALYGGSPPPEEADHPVCGGDSRHPLVRLPNAKPKVRLPPAPSASHAKPTPAVAPQRVASYRVGAQPLVANQDWQARFNGLFGRAQVHTRTPPSPPKTPPKAQDPPLAVAPSSRITIDLASSIPVPATVSMPHKKPARFEAISRPGVDDIFDGELSFGSTPKVFLPKNADYPEPFDETTFPKSVSRVSKSIDARSMAELPPSVFDNLKLDIIIMKLPRAWATPKEILMRKHTPKAEAQARKSSTKAPKNKRHASGPNLGAPSESTKGALRSASSRNTSFQKGQAPDTEQPIKTPSPLNDQITGGGDENSLKRSNWSKPSRGHGRNSSYKPRP